jgi:hypothetical protein
MAKIFESITSELQAWLSNQKIFFVATAPLSKEAHLNCSPKGGDTFRVLNGSEVAYLDLTGSGVETIAHLQENSRIVVMFCAFQGAPRIVRIHGKGEVFYPGTPPFDRMINLFPDIRGIRSIIRIKVSRLSDSCGYAVPLYNFVGHRDVLEKWCDKKGPQGLVEYRKIKNAKSIDDLPGYKRASD